MDRIRPGGHLRRPAVDGPAGRPRVDLFSRSLLLVAVLLANTARLGGWVRAGHQGIQTARHQNGDAKLALITIKR